MIVVFFHWTHQQENYSAPGRGSKYHQVQEDCCLGLSLLLKSCHVFDISLYVIVQNKSVWLACTQSQLLFFFFCCAWLFPRWTSIFLSIQKMTAFSQIIWWKKLKIMWTENLKINFLVDNQITLKLHFIYKNVVNKYQSIPRAYYIGKPQ